MLCAVLGKTRHITYCLYLPYLPLRQRTDCSVLPLKLESLLIAISVEVLHVVPALVVVTDLPQYAHFRCSVRGLYDTVVVLESHVKTHAIVPPRANWDRGMHHDWIDHLLCPILILSLGADVPIPADDANLWVSRREIGGEVVNRHVLSSALHDRHRLRQRLHVHEG